MSSNPRRASPLKCGALGDLLERQAEALGAADEGQKFDVDAENPVRSATWEIEKPSMAPTVKVQPVSRVKSESKSVALVVGRVEAQGAGPGVAPRAEAAGAGRLRAGELADGQAVDIGGEVEADQHEGHRGSVRRAGLPRVGASPTGFHPTSCQSTMARRRRS